MVLKTAKMDWVTKTIILRNPPITSVFPMPRQAEWRYLFAENAVKWKGSRGRAPLKYDSRSGKHKAGDIVLAVQAKAQEVLKEVARTHTWKNAPRPPELKPKYSHNAKETLKKIAGL